MRIVNLVLLLNLSSQACRSPCGRTGQRLSNSAHSGVSCRHSKRRCSTVSHCMQKGQAVEVAIPRRKRLVFVNIRSLLANEIKILHLFGV